MIQRFFAPIIHTIVFLAYSLSLILFYQSRICGLTSDMTFVYNPSRILQCGPMGPDMGPHPGFMEDDG